MARLSATEIKARAKGGQRKPVDTAWGHFFIRKVPADEKGRARAYLLAFDDPAERIAHWEAAMVQVGLVDEDGALIFKREDVPELAKLPDEELRPVAEEVARYNGWSDEKDDLKKNSPATPTAASPGEPSSAEASAPATEPPTSSSPPSRRKSSPS